MFCKMCGAENYDGATVCVSCGEPLAGGGGGQDMGPRPKNYLVESILVTLCCCLILGIVAIVYAAQVDSKWSSGDYAGAQQAAENAKKWCWISFGLGLTINLIYLAINIIAATQGGMGQF